ncbi:hypothetical protein, partial [Psychrobacter vallis]|uniref:hypothetical protein n=1 Tax=Psychrobacter vallis TaxID=248451 RepID=UPI001D12829D
PLQTGHFLYLFLIDIIYASAHIELNLVPINVPPMSPPRSNAGSPPPKTANKANPPIITVETMNPAASA